MNNPFQAHPGSSDSPSSDAPPERIPKTASSPFEMPKKKAVKEKEDEEVSRMHTAPEAEGREGGSNGADKPSPSLKVSIDEMNQQVKRPTGTPETEEQGAHHLSEKVPEKKIETRRPPSASASQSLTPPPLGMDEMSCRTCRFFESSGQNRGIATEGECRCKAPRPGADSIAQWPAVGWQSWCGEWELGISDEEMVKMARIVADRMNGTVRESFASPEQAGNK